MALKPEPVGAWQLESHLLAQLMAPLSSGIQAQPSCRASCSAAPAPHGGRRGDLRTETLLLGLIYSWFSKEPFREEMWTVTDKDKLLKVE